MLLLNYTCTWVIKLLTSLVLLKYTGNSTTDVVYTGVNQEFNRGYIQWIIILGKQIMSIHTLYTVNRNDRGAWLRWSPSVLHNWRLHAALHQIAIGHTSSAWECSYSDAMTFLVTKQRRPEEKWCWVHGSIVGDCKFISNVLSLTEVLLQNSHAECILLVKLI